MGFRDGDILVGTEKGEEIRSEFFANASHELKTPLTAIKGFNDVIGMKSKDDDIRTLSAKIDKEVNRIVSLIDDMLNLSKLETTKTPIVEKVDLVAVAYDAEESISALARDKNVNIEISGEGTVDMEKDHAYKLVLTHPKTKEIMTFTAPIPDYFQAVLDILEKRS